MVKQPASQGSLTKWRTRTFAARTYGSLSKAKKAALAKVEEWYKERVGEGIQAIKRNKDDYFPMGVGLTISQNPKNVSEAVWLEVAANLRVFEKTRICVSQLGIEKSHELLLAEYRKRFVLPDADLLAEIRAEDLKSHIYDEIRRLHSGKIASDLIRHIETGFVSDKLPKGIYYTICRSVSSSNKPIHSIAFITKKEGRGRVSINRYGFLKALSLARDRSHNDVKIAISAHFDEWTAISSELRKRIEIDCREKAQLWGDRINVDLVKRIHDD